MGGGTPRLRPYLGIPSGTGPAGGVGPDGIAGGGAATNESSSTSGLRPFVLTSGRVAATDSSIALETQVTARHMGPGWGARALEGLSPESAAIVALCAVPMSVAEISARLQLHLGVARILVSDLRAAGYLDVHTEDVTHYADPDTIMRVIRGLRAIS